MSSKGGNPNMGGTSDQRSRLVWSSDAGGRVDTCPRCGEPRARCQCAPDRGGKRAGAPRRDLPRDGIIRLAREKKGRGGKVVTLVSGVPGDGAALVALAQDLKRACGAGGTVEGDLIIIQGDHRGRLEAKLRAMGYTVKKAGG